MLNRGIGKPLFIFLVIFSATAWSNPTPAETFFSKLHSWKSEFLIAWGIESTELYVDATLQEAFKSQPDHAQRMFSDLNQSLRNISQLRPEGTPQTLFQLPTNQEDRKRVKLNIYIIGDWESFEEKSAVRQKQLEESVRTMGEYQRAESGIEVIEHIDFSVRWKKKQVGLAIYQKSKESGIEQINLYLSAGAAYFRLPHVNNRNSDWQTSTEFTFNALFHGYAQLFLDYDFDTLNMLIAENMSHNSPKLEHIQMSYMLRANQALLASSHFQGPSDANQELSSLIVYCEHSLENTKSIAQHQHELKNNEATFGVPTLVIADESIEPFIGDDLSLILDPFNRALETLIWIRTQEKEPLRPDPHLFPFPGMVPLTTPWPAVYDNKFVDIHIVSRDSPLFTAIQPDFIIFEKFAYRWHQDSSGALRLQIVTFIDSFMDANGSQTVDAEVQWISILSRIAYGPLLAFVNFNVHESNHRSWLAFRSSQLANIDLHMANDLAAIESAQVLLGEAVGYPAAKDFPLGADTFIEQVEAEIDELKSGSANLAVSQCREALFRKAQ